MAHIDKKLWHANGIDRCPSLSIFTGDGFRDLVDFICEPELCNPRLLQPPLSDGIGLHIIIYVKQDYLHYFIENIILYPVMDPVRVHVMDPVFDKLPVILVNNWENVTLLSIKAAHEKIQDG